MYYNILWIKMNEYFSIEKVQKEKKNLFPLKIRKAIILKYAIVMFM